MRAKLFILFFIILCQNAFGQVYELSYWDALDRLKLVQSRFFDCDAQSVDWKGIESEVPFEQKQVILSSLGRGDFYDDQLKQEDQKLNYASHYHFLDLDEDGDLDIIYNAADGADGPLVLVYRKTNEGYNKIGFTRGNVTQIKSEKGITDLFVEVYPYFGYYEAELLQYQITADSIKEKKIEYLSGTFFPSSTEAGLPEFETQQETYNLRTSPEIKNSPCFENEAGDQYCGNLYLSVPNGTRGKAFAKEIDETGREWWLARMELSDGSSLLGWLSSRYVKVLK